MKYLINIMPLEAYIFGTDQKFKYPGEKRTGKESYFIKSNEVPEQTTILGLLRFLILKQKGFLCSNFQYTAQERSMMKSYIGANSFSFEKIKKQDFGCIKEISPIFLMDETGDYYVKNPFNNKQNNGYVPIELTKNEIETSAGNIRLPKIGEYDTKKGHAVGYYNLNKGKVYENLFFSNIIAGNRKNNKESDEDCFFKKEFITLKKGYSFAVFVDITEDIIPRKEIGYMGLGKSAFLITSKLVKENDLVKRVKTALSKSIDTWIYALSDLYIQDSITYNTFSIIEQKQMRNLETKYNAENSIKKLKRSRKQFNMIQKGSVFFGQCDLDVKNDNCQQIGYNQIVELGGK